MALYDVWFSTKRRKWLLQGDVGEAAKELILAVAREKNIEPQPSGWGRESPALILIRPSPA